VVLVSDVVAVNRKQHSEIRQVRQLSILLLSTIVLVVAVVVVVLDIVVVVITMPVVVSCNNEK
jgi:hypothetical protein